jgi:hypothetical protein
MIVTYKRVTSQRKMTRQIAELAAESPTGATIVKVVKVVTIATIAKGGRKQRLTR